MRFRTHKAGKNEFIDFSSASLVQIHDGNTLSNGRFVRRGLPVLSDEFFKVPAKQNYELVSYLKTNGDCCMFSYHAGLKTYIVASRTISVLIRSA
jgi:hypothetical protein